MCMFKPPKMEASPTPAPLPPPIETVKTVESVDFGSTGKADTEKATGIKGDKSTGKSSLKISKSGVNKNIGANYQVK